ncbi:MAG: translation initiation factor [Spirulinaceae cyanobacterium]
MSKKRKSSSHQRIAYQEFGEASQPEALERGQPDLHPNQQNLQVQSTRKGRKGKTVTVISGFQSKLETLSPLLKQIKSYCGSGGTLKDNTLEIQGDHKEKICQFLQKLGYKAKISGG